jgi:hypothetical protein
VRVYDHFVRMIAIAWMLAGLGCPSDAPSPETLAALTKATENGRYMETTECHYPFGCTSVSNRGVLVDQQLLRSARNAVGRGDCARVVEIDIQMRKIDADFHDTVFVRDAALARCLAPNAAR